MLIVVPSLLADDKNAAAQTYFQQGLQAVKAQQFEMAAESFRQALAIEPGMIAARKNLATVLWFLNHHQESEREFREVLRVAPNDPVPHLYLGLAAFDRREFETAVTCFEKAGDLALNNPEIRQTVTKAYLGAAEEFDRNKQPEKALAALQAAIRLNPDADAPYVSLASFASAHGNDQFALGVLNKGLERRPASASLLLERGILEAFEGRFESAEIDFRASTQVDANASLPLIGLGITQLQLGHSTDAAVTFHAVLAQWPADARAHYLYALALDRTGDPARQQELIGALQTAIRLDPDDASSHALLGRVLWSANQRTQGIRELETAVRLDPHQRAALYQLAMAYRSMGRSESATRILQQFNHASAHSEQNQAKLLQILKTVQDDNHPEK